MAARLQEELRPRDLAIGRLQGLVQSSRKTFELLSVKLTDQERDAAENAFAKADGAKEGTLEEVQGALDHLETIAELLGKAMLRG